MTEPVSSIRNLGPAVEGMFARVGVTTAEQLRELGADEGYRMVLKNGVRPLLLGITHLLWGCRDGLGMIVRASRKRTCAKSLISLSQILLAQRKRAAPISKLPLISWVLGRRINQPVQDRRRRMRFLLQLFLERQNREPNFRQSTVRSLCGLCPRQRLPDWLRP